MTVKEFDEVMGELYAKIEKAQETVEDLREDLRSITRTFDRADKFTQEQLEKERTHE